MLLTLDEGYLLTTALPDLQHGIVPLGPPAPAQPWLLGRGVAPPARRPWPGALGRGVAPPVGNSPSNEYSELISFRIDWFDLFAIQGTLKNLLQHHSSKASILWHSAFFMVQLSNPYMNYWKKTRALTIWTFVSKVMSLFFNMLSSLVIAFLPWSKHLLIEGRRRGQQRMRWLDGITDSMHMNLS